MPLTIHDDYGEGGAGVGSTKTAKHPRIADVVRGMIDDRPATIASADAVASVGVPTKAEFDAVVVLVNEMKAALNATKTVVKG